MYVKTNRIAKPVTVLICLELNELYPSGIHSNAIPNDSPSPRQIHFSFEQVVKIGDFIEGLQKSNKMFQARHDFMA